MSALIAVTTPDRIFLATDAAVYTRAGAVVGFRGKIDPVPQWPGALAALGNAAISPLLARALALEFRRWDDFVDGAEKVLPGMIADMNLPSGADIVAVGISRRRGPEAFTWTTDGALPPGTTPEEAAASPYRGNVCRLVRLPAVVMSPTANDQVQPAQWEGIRPDADPAAVEWSIRKWFEMARHSEACEKFGAIGGFSTLCTITRDHVVQKVLCEWPEDSTGGPLRVWPIDWAAWHRENPKPSHNRSSQTLTPQGI